MRGLIRTGDKGQRYEVLAKHPNKITEVVIGWSETLEGAKSFTDGIEIHPVFHSPRIVDREKGK